jgi:hypothetical protein
MVSAETQVLNGVDVRFDKEYYSTVEDNTVNINFEIFNNNKIDSHLMVYIECEDDSDDLECDYSKEFTLSSESSRTGSFNIITSEEGNYEVNLHVLDLDSTDSDEIEFSIDLDVDEDNDMRFTR